MIEPDANPMYAQQLRAIRQRHGWTQRQLAYELSVSVRTIREWEHGRTQPNARDQVLFAELLERPIA